MDLALGPEQQVLVDAVETLLSRHAGPVRARQLRAGGATYDHDLDAALDGAGFLSLSRDPEAGPLESALVVEAVARHAGVVAVGARALVAAALTDDALASPIALATDDDRAPVRFGTDARTLLVAGTDDAIALPIAGPNAIEEVPTRYGYPLARVPARAGGRVVGSAARLRAWWRVAVAVEMAGAMRASLDLTLGYVRDRHQFGRPIGSFQALQHRLAEAAVLVEGARWLVLEAAWLGAPEEAAATAALYAAAAAHRVSTDMHQITGALGFTTEYDLHFWTMRLQALRLELGGVPAHARTLAASRWVGATP